MGNSDCRLGQPQSTRLRQAQWLALRLIHAPPLDNNSIPRLPPECNRQNTQNRDFYFLDICATFLLTKAEGCGIMENSGRCDCRRPAQKTRHLFHSRSSKVAGKCHTKILVLCSCSGSHPLNPIHNALHASPIFVATRRAHSSAVKIKLYKSIYKLAISGATPTSIS